MWPAKSSVAEEVSVISIHTSREGCDSCIFRIRQFQKHFNPHIPWEMWQCRRSFQTIPYKFQSTHPVRDVTLSSDMWNDLLIISIHTSREGCDQRTMQARRSTRYFNPHIPWGMWRGAFALCRNIEDFNPHIPWGMWHEIYKGHYLSFQFQSTHPVRDVTREDWWAYEEGSFQSTHPVRDVTRMWAIW